MIGPLAAVALGLSAGAMLAEGALLVPWWRSMAPDAFLAWYASHASALVSFYGPLEVGSAVLAVAAAALDRRRGRRGFVVAAVLAVVVLVAYPLYFQQVNASFADGTIERGRVAGELGRWAAWHSVRTAIGIVACAAAVLAVQATGRRPGA